MGLATVISDPRPSVVCGLPTLLVSTELLSRFQDTVSIQSASFFLYVLSSSQGFQDTLSVTSAMIL